MGGMWLYNYDKLVALNFCPYNSSASGSTEQYYMTRARNGTWYSAVYCERDYGGNTANSVVAFRGGIQSTAAKSDSTTLVYAYWRVGLLSADFDFDYYTYNATFCNTVGTVSTVYDRKTYESGLLKRDVQCVVPVTAEADVYGFALTCGSGYYNYQSGYETLIYIEKLDTPQRFLSGENAVISFTQTIPCPFVGQS